MFPADAGMNRQIFIVILLCLSVPRRRGDEPYINSQAYDAILCSPQTRG